LQEIRALRSISHPNVIALHEDNIDTERRFPGFVMDLATTNLANYTAVAERPAVAPAEAVWIMRAIVSAIIALHAHSPRIVHRDINPNNILRLIDGRWVLADFGLAKFIGTGPLSTGFATQTQPGLGTTYYAAPEQYRDFKRTDERTDIFALGVLLWELFSSAWPPPDSQRLGLPDDLAMVYVRATQREPEARYPTALQFKEVLERSAMFRQYQ
jgi:serine/threonine-protein kinase